LAEVGYLLDFWYRVGYLKGDICKKIFLQQEEAMKVLRGLINYLENEEKRRV